MVSLSYRSFANYIVEDNLVGLRGFLENRHVVVDDRDENGATALLLASIKGKSAFVRELLAHGADPNAEDSDNWTALLCAAKENYTTICVELLNHGASIEHRDMGGWTALVWACYKGYLETARLLIEQRAEVNVHGQFHITPLMWASGRGHVPIVQLLLEHGAKVNAGDKYGTTALIWACRKSHSEIVDMLLQAGANVEVSGMHCWTPLLLAAKENAADIVNKLLDRKPNVNATDKDGCTALTLACKEGYYDICMALLNSGAYVNLQDRSGDTNLIHAAKAGHKSIVEALLKKYADIDMTGKERKTALYWAVEKNHVSVVRSLLNSDPNLEISTKEGDTPLLRAVRNRNIETVQLLLDKKARVTAADKEGDTVLHIAMRARSKAIVEILLRNPKHSQLLYRPNRSGETPYNIDISQQKTILGQIFGARRLNTNEDNENMLGYELYSSALADMLSEPSLSMPITVGLYAKWGSGKSFLLSKLRDEMKGFARQWIEPQLQFSAILFIVVLHVATLLGVILGVSLDSWIAGVATGAGSFFLITTFLYIVYWGTERFSWNWAHNFGIALARKLESLKLVLQVTFCTPPGPQWGGDSIRIQPIRFYFTDQTKVSRSTRGENSVVQMIGSLLDSIEADYGVVATRLYRAFRPKPMKSTSPWRFRRFCCIPYAAIFLICVDILLAGLVFLAIYQMEEIDDRIVNSNNVRYTLIAIGVVLGVVVIANVYTWSQIVKSLVFSQRRKLQRIISRLQSVRAEGYLQALKREVGIMVEMVRCLDAYSGQQTRLVMVVDGLDSCEQDQVLYVLDAVHLLFTEQSSPFITLLAIDPHIIIKAIELNLHRMFNESNIGGHDYLRNLVHVPFFLQNAGLRKVKAAQQAALMSKNPGGGRTTMITSNSNHAAVLNWLESEENANNQPTGDRIPMSPRRMSVESSAPQGKSLLRGKLSSALPPSMGHRKLRPSESMESGLAMGNNNGRVMAAQDLTKVLLTDDYFSDVNPRSMRRLMNVIYVTGRLLKAFQIEFNWYHLASWVNITEQWPYRTSWIILYCEVNEDKLDDFTTLKVAYERVKPFIPISKDVEPHLEIDRDEKKFQTFLSFHRNTLQILHLKMFMPFTIHLDPYLRKVIKEERSSFLAMQTGAPVSHSNTADIKITGDVPGDPPHPPMAMHVPWNGQPWTTVTLPTPDQNKQTMYPKYPPMVPTITHCNYGVMPATTTYLPSASQLCFNSTLPSRLQDRALSSLSAEDVSEMLRHLDGIRTTQAEQYARTLIDSNISGRVLLNCNLDELKTLSGMSFGDWELFRVAVLTLREREYQQPRMAPSPNPQQSSVGQTHSNHQQAGTYHFLDVADYDGRLSRSSSLRSAVATGETVTEVDTMLSAPKINPKRQTNIEKQVTLEDQAICGALQTLNEEAMEDVLDERETEYLAGSDLMAMNIHGYNSSNLSTCSDPAETDVLYLQTSVVPDLHFPALRHANSVLGSRALVGNEDSVSLGSSLLSLAERGTTTPARQRTITEVVWPEQIASALNNGLRSRLSSSTSLFRAGSQKSVVASDNTSYGLGRRDSQRSISDLTATKPLYVSVGVISNINESNCPTTSGSSPTAGWRSEQGSPRRPASLVLNESMNPHDWSAKPVHDTSESPLNENRLKVEGRGDGTPTAASSSSPVVVHKRFSTTNVELLPDQVAAKLQMEKPQTATKSSVRSPSKQRVRRTGQYQSRTHSGTSSSGLQSTSRHSSGKSSDDTTDEEGEDAPLMTAAKEHHIRRALPKAAVLAIKESRSLSASTGNISKAEGPVAVNVASSAIGSQSSLASPIGSSTSSLDSPVDTTDNEVYKTVIPKADSSRRENSLALMLNRPINEIGDTAGNVATALSKPNTNISIEKDAAAEKLE